MNTVMHDVLCGDVLTVLCENDQNLQSTFDKDLVSAVALHRLEDGLVQGAVYHRLLEVFCIKSIALTLCVIFKILVT